ncbi:hypothetical protein M2R47_03280 [Moraxella sp. Tifton1]|uniref:DUF2147 domain-containing protein n=1 Tax=Moraxella oculi TaxID=2940516 RepID=A0ABW8U4G0_9GAMM|nr:hypothetical protein [Moraxella sp. Tifton1]MCL1623275.1 hypothetical protein [Moraxella sp. Tifton1]
MKRLAKFAAVSLGMVISTAALANNDAIVGTWKMSEKGEEKAIIKITKVGDGYQAVMTKGLTKKAQKREGATVIKDIKPQGSGKYAGKGKHPTLPISGTANITLNGNNITISSRAGTQVGVRYTK